MSIACLNAYTRAGAFTSHIRACLTPRRSSDGTHDAFIASTPERLYVRSGRLVASEAVAGTRPRGEGDVEKDFWLSLDLLNRQALGQTSCVYVHMSGISVGTILDPMHPSGGPWNVK